MRLGWASATGFAWAAVSCAPWHLQANAIQEIQAEVLGRLADPYVGEKEGARQYCVASAEGDPAVLLRERFASFDLPLQLASSCVSRETTGRVYPDVLFRLGPVEGLGGRRARMQGATVSSKPVGDTFTCTFELERIQGRWAIVRKQCVTS
jgi:hypothetical protein